MTDYSLSVKSVLAVLSITEGSYGAKKVKRLTVTRWNGGPEKLDIRVWLEGTGSQARPGKGITLSLEEAKILADSLTEFLKSKQIPPSP